MIFGRRNRSVSTDEEVEDAFEDTDLDRDEESEKDELDPRHDGPFDFEEVELEGDGVNRVAFGPLIVTPFDGLNIQLTGDEASGTILALLAIWENSGLELALFAAPTLASLADELLEDTVEEAEQAGGSCQVVDGLFGPEVRRVLPLEGPEGEQLFHVSRIWLVDGPGWLLRGTLMGPAAVVENDGPPADAFIELFRNVVVHRDDSPRVPGEVIELSLPDAQE